jgi:hypothetical protein
MIDVASDLLAEEDEIDATPDVDRPLSHAAQARLADEAAGLQVKPAPTKG